MLDIYETFIDHVNAKQDRMRRVMWQWTPVARGQNIDDAVRGACLKCAAAIPRLTDDVREQIDEMSKPSSGPKSRLSARSK